MDTLMVDLPADVKAELEQRQISDEEVQVFVVEAIKNWLRKGAKLPEETNAGASPFAESAIPYIDTLIDENRSLFDRYIQNAVNSPESPSTAQIIADLLVRVYEIHERIIAPHRWDRGNARPGRTAWRSCPSFCDVRQPGSLPR